MLSAVCFLGLLHPFPAHWLLKRFPPNGRPQSLIMGTQTSGCFGCTRGEVEMPFPTTDNFKGVNAPVPSLP